MYRKVLYYINRHGVKVKILHNYDEIKLEDIKL